MWSVVVALPAVQAEFGVGARRCVAPLHADDARLRRRRHRDGPPVRPLRHHGRPSSSARCRSAPATSAPRRPAARAVRARPRRSSSASAARRRSRRCSRTCRCGSRAGAASPSAIFAERQLPRRHGLAADRAAFHRDRRLARDVSRHCACSASSRCCRWRCVLRRPPPHPTRRAGAVPRPGHPAALGAARRSALQTLLLVAGVSCCVAMSMPQVHLVAYCGDLGYGAARGAQMLSLMLALRHREPAHVRLHLRPDRRAADAADRIDAAGAGAVPVPAVRRPRVALRDLGAVRPVPGRHRAVVRDHRPRVLPGAARPGRASAS